MLKIRKIFVQRVKIRTSSHGCIIRYMKIVKSGESISKPLLCIYESISCHSPGRRINVKCGLKKNRPNSLSFMSSVTVME